MSVHTCWDRCTCMPPAANDPTLLQVSRQELSQAGSRITELEAQVQQLREAAEAATAAALQQAQHHHHHHQQAQKPQHSSRHASKSVKPPCAANGSVTGHHSAAAGSPAAADRHHDRAHSSAPAAASAPSQEELQVGCRPGRGCALHNHSLLAPWLPLTIRWAAS